MSADKKIPLPPTPYMLDAPPVLDARLSAPAALCREGAVMADVGTDHAYLPIALLRAGKSRFAVATDIHRKPAEIAAAHLSACGIRDDRAVVLCTDGLHDAEQFSPSDICILGMGGEMIARIIDEAPWVKSPSIRLILQPMTRMEALRAYLAEHGFAIIEEVTARTDRIYQIICAEYDGRIRTPSPLSLLLGEQSMARRDPLCLEFAKWQRTILLASREGKARGRQPDTSREDELIAAIDCFLSETTTSTEVSP